MNDLERGEECFHIIARDDPQKAHEILENMMLFILNPPADAIEFLFENGGIRPYHHDDTLDEVPYSFEETIEFLRLMHQRLASSQSF